MAFARGSSDDGHWACNGLAAPPSGDGTAGSRGLCSARLRLVFLLDQSLRCDRLRLGPPVNCAVNPPRSSLSEWLQLQDYPDLAAQGARFERRRLANSIPQRLSFENCVIRDRLPCVVPLYRPFWG